jgi:hypothetical protein
MFLKTRDRDYIGFYPLKQLNLFCIIMETNEFMNGYQVSELSECDNKKM